MRTQPLKETKCDISEFNNYGNELGYPSYHEYTPYFYNRAKVPINIEGMYGGESLFIIAGGPSLKSIDFDLLRTPGVMLMTINNSIVNLLIRNITPNFSVFCDQPDSMIKQMLLNPSIQKFTPFNNHGKKLWDNQEWKPLDKTLRECTNIAYFFRNEKFLAERWFLERSINWGTAKDIGDLRSTLLASIKISYVLGFRKIYLLGVDFDMSQDKKYAFNENRSENLIKSNNRNYKLMAEKYLPKIKKQGELLKFFIFNCNKDSKLKVFDYVSLKEAIDTATKKCSPTNIIETRGLYNIEYKEKLKLTRQEAIDKNSR